MLLFTQYSEQTNPKYYFDNTSTNWAGQNSIFCIFNFQLDLSPNVQLRQLHVPLLQQAKQQKKNILNVSISNFHLSLRLTRNSKNRTEKIILEEKKTQSEKERNICANKQFVLWKFTMEVGIVIGIYFVQSVFFGAFVYLAMKTKKTKTTFGKFTWNEWWRRQKYM